MPCLSGRYNPSVGLLINIGVYPAGSFSPTGSAPPQISTFPALIDTGASGTCISPLVAQTLGLQPVGLRPMISATSAVPVSAYLVDLVIPFGQAGFVIGGTMVLEFAPHAGSPFQILVGRDIICKGTLSLSFDGHFSFSL